MTSEGQTASLSEGAPEARGRVRPTREPQIRGRVEEIVAIVALAVAVVVFLSLAYFIDRPIVDDAVISVGYARSLADGVGLRPTPYSPVVEGFSNPTWTFFLFVFEALRINSMAIAKHGGLAFATLSLPLVFLWGPVSQRRRPQIEDAVAPLAACTSGTLAYWAMGGLEIGLLLFFLGLFGVLLAIDRTPRVGIAVGLTAAGITLTRPEGGLYVTVFAAPWVLASALERTLVGRPNRLALIAFVLPVASYLAFRRLYFGAYLPNTYYAKSAWFIGVAKAEVWALGYIGNFIQTSLALVVAGVVGVLVSVLGRRRVWAMAFSAIGLVLSMCFFTWQSRGDWMREWRFLAPTLPFLGYSVGAALSAVRTLSSRPFFATRRLARIGARVLVSAAVLLALVKTSFAHAARWRQVKEMGGDVPREPKDRARYGEEIRALVAPFRMTHPLVAAPDMGWLQVGLRDYELLDMAGLMDVAIARHFNNFPALRDYLENEGLPTVLLYWGPSTWLARTPSILEHFRDGPSSSFLIYKGVTPTSDDRCPDGKQRALEIDPDELLRELQADVDDGRPVVALARWRCSLSYRKDDGLPPVPRRVALAWGAEQRARTLEHAGEPELALRYYSACAVLGSAAVSPSVSCRMNAERLREQLFPRPGARLRRRAR